jgi:4-amino-4-deoxy-L-arabinose transferase-like glycosyltransferase
MPGAAHRRLPFHREERVTALTQETAAPAESPLGRVRAWELALVIGLLLALYVPRLGSYSLWDPWESHYAEVARGMLEDHDWIKMKWGTEGPFRSKPVLTFWLMSAGMKLFGVGADGGFSGEFISSPRVEWGLRLPFALSGVAGLAILWFALAKLYSKRAAWLATFVLASMPYYFMVSHQAITDMPSCAMLIGSMALLALAIFDDKPLRRWRGLTSHHAFLAAFAIVVLGQLIYFSLNVTGNKLFLTPKSWIPGPWVMVPFYVGFVLVAAWTTAKARSTRQVYMFWFYLLNGVAVLAKGPVAPALAGLTIIGYLAATGDWKLLAKLEIPRGVLIACAVCLPWHFAIYLKDGNGWLNEYIGTHILGRAFKGVFGDRGTFDYFFGPLGYGMWPWGCLVPGALAHVALRPRAQSREEKVRLMFAVWAILGFAFFVFVQTKFRHYILPAVPAMAVVAALWLDDVWTGKIPGAAIAVVAAIGLFLLTSIDFVTRQERIINLYIFRYDRPWPYAPPFSLDYSGVLLVFALLFGIGLLVLLAPRWRRQAIVGLLAVGVGFTVFVVNVMLVAASAHWGQRALFENYYQHRVIHGADLIYYGPKELAEDWGGTSDFVVRSVIPETLHVGDDMKITWQLRNAQDGVQEKGELQGKVSSIDVAGHRFAIAVSADERAKIAPAVALGKGVTEERRRWVYVNAERMIGWQLNWKGENFYTGGEIWNVRIPDMMTSFSGFNDDNDKKLLDYLKPRIGQGRTFWVASEIGSIPRLKAILPTPKAQETYEVMDHSSNKFGLARFTLDAGEQPASIPASQP